MFGVPAYKTGNLHTLKINRRRTKEEKRDNWKKIGYKDAASFSFENTHKASVASFD